MIILDDAFDFYENTKREKNKETLLIYDLDRNIFSKGIKKAKKYVPFLDSNMVCLEIINMYLNLPHISCYKNDCKRKMRESNNKVVAFLWFFDHINGCYDFGNFEISIMTKKLIEWCKSYNFEYMLPEVYVQQSGRTIY